VSTSQNVDVSGEAGGQAQGVGQLVGFERQRRSELRRSWDRFKRFRPGVVAAVFIVLLCIIALMPQVFEPYDPNQPASSLRGEGPSWDHPLGRDDIGRDILSRLIRGTRVALIVGVFAMLISLTVGVTVGAVSGYFGGWIDTILSRFVDALLAFPILVLLIVLAAVLGPSLSMTVWVIGLTVWSTYARVVRADVLSARERDYVFAARAIGANDLRIIIRHVLPNVLGPVIVLATLSVGGIIILEAALSFLGFGIQRPTASWGNMLADARATILTFGHIAIPPGVMIFLTVLAFNLVGDGLRDALDPRQRE
jgi:ABC-type dipeptide/oligopeptide/nickel transport system permease subunit